MAPPSGCTTRCAVRRALKRATRLVTTTSVMADRVAELRPDARSRTVVIPLAADAAFRPPVDAAEVGRHAHKLLGTSRSLLPRGRSEQSDKTPRRCASCVCRRRAAAVASCAPATPDRRESAGFADRCPRRRGSGHLAADDSSTGPCGAAAGRRRAAAAVPLRRVRSARGRSDGVWMSAGRQRPADTSRSCRRRSHSFPARATSPRSRRPIASVAELRRHAVRLVDPRTRAIEGFSWDRCARDTLAVYRDAAACGGAPSFR